MPIMRMFNLVRSVDVTGASGTGIVAHGCVFDDGTVAMRWLTATRSTALYNSIEDVATIHGHEGATVVEVIPYHVYSDVDGPYCTWRDPDGLPCEKDPDHEGNHLVID